MKNHLIIYAKQPRPGYVKTRLGQEIGMEEAAGIYARLLFHLLAHVATHFDPRTWHIQLSLASEDDLAFFEKAYPAWEVAVQVDGDLGCRMYTSIQNAFKAGAGRVILVGSDIPDLNQIIIERALRLLDSMDIVFGATLDGGFYLAAMSCPGINVFQDIDWSTDRVMEQISCQADEQQFSVGFVDILYDIDTKNDYWLWHSKQ